MSKSHRLPAQQKRPQPAPARGGTSLPTGPRGDGREWACRGAAFLLPLALYTWTLAPTVTFEDSGEFITVAWTLGIAHPSGYPLWTLIAHAFTWLPVGNPAQRVHFCSAFFAAASMLMLYVLARRMRVRRLPALAAALAIAGSRILWSQAVTAKGIYALNGFLTLLALYWVIRWRESQRPRWLWAFAFTLGLGQGNHPLLTLLAPPMALWALLGGRWRALMRPRMILVACMLFLLGLGVYAYIPIRARQNPPANWGRPTTVAKTIEHYRRSSFKTDQEQRRYLGRPADIAGHTLAAFAGGARALTWPVTVIALVGGIVLVRRRPGLFWTTGAMIVLNTLVLNVILHVQFNSLWSFVHRVYYIPAHLLAGLWLAEGFQWVLRTCRTFIPRPISGRRLAISLIVVFALLPSAVHFKDNNCRHNFMARNFGLDLLASAPPDCGILPLSDEVTFTVLYMREVEGQRRDVKILSDAFGWNNEPVPVVVAEVPPSEQILKTMPAFKGMVGFPTGLLYAFVRPETIPRDAPRFRPLPCEPHWPSPAAKGEEYDPFAAHVRGFYAVYASRLGASAYAHGDRAAANALFARAEALGRDYSFAQYELARALDRSGAPRDRVNALLEGALATYDRTIDPANDYYYPITRADILSALADPDRFITGEQGY